MPRWAWILVIAAVILIAYVKIRVFSMLMAKRRKTQEEGEQTDEQDANTDEEEKALSGMPRQNTIVLQLGAAF